MAEGYSVNTILLFVIILIVFVVAFASYFGYEQYKQKKAEKQTAEEIPMTSIAQETIPMSPTKPTQDSHLDLPGETNLNRRSLYDSEFYVSKDRKDPFARIDIDTEAQ